MKVPAFIIGGIALVMSVWFAIAAQAQIDQLVAIQSDMAQGFNSSFFTGKHMDTSNLPKAGFGFGLILDVIGSLALIASGFMFKNEPISQSSKG